MCKKELPFLTKTSKAHSKSESLRTTIPKEIVKDSGLDSHDVLIWDFNKKNNEIIIKKWGGKDI